MDLRHGESRPLVMGGFRSGYALASALALKSRIDRTRRACIARGDWRLLKILADLVTNLFHDFSVLLPVPRLVIPGEKLPTDVRVTQHRRDHRKDRAQGRRVS